MSTAVKKPPGKKSTDSKSAASKSNRLEVKRLISSSPACVFRSWTTPDQLKRWFGPAGCRVLEAQVDLRVGGAYRFHVAGDQMGEMAVRGTYREITEPSKLVFTWQWEDDPDWEKVASTVTVEFKKAEDGTEVCLTHEGLPSKESAERHEHGWNGCLDKLADQAAVMAELYGPGHFGWNELLTTDVPSATRFYTQLFGWSTVPFGEDQKYTLWQKNGSGVGGLMQVPQPGTPPQWLAYIIVDDADAIAEKVTKLGGEVLMAPFDIPKVGRIAVLKDPQGATFGIYKSLA